MRLRMHRLIDVITRLPRPRLGPGPEGGRITPYAVVMEQNAYVLVFTHRK